MLVLVVNAGSSSLKYQLVDADSGEVFANGLVERIGEDEAALTHKTRIGREELEVFNYSEVAKNHAAAFAWIQRAFAETGEVTDAGELGGVGHRVVHGGEAFSEPTLIDDDVIAGIDAVSPLAPLHNPANLTGIRAAKEAFPDVPHVAIFDTAFHQSIPAAAYTYAIDREVAKQYQIRRYGFHGTSHAFVSRAAAKHLGIAVEDFNAVVLHVGNGASATAVRGGKSVETSMGLSPLEGLVMGTRSGDIDPAVIFHLCSVAGMSVADVDALLNKKSGLKGLAGDNDLRAVHARIAEGDETAQLGLDVYVHRLKKYVGAYLAVLGRADAIIFTAGVGENDKVVRSEVCKDLENLGIVFDESANQAGRQGAVTKISAEGSPIAVLIVETNEELEIARQTMQAIGTH